MTPTQAKVAGILFRAAALSGLLALLMGLVAAYAANTWWDQVVAQGPEAMSELRRWAFGGSWDIAYVFVIIVGPIVVGALTMLATALYLLGRLYWPPLRTRLPPIIYFGLLFVAWPILKTVLHGFWELPFVELIFIVPGLFWGLCLQIDLERYLAIDTAD